MQRTSETGHIDLRAVGLALVLAVAAGALATAADHAGGGAVGGDLPGERLDFTRGWTFQKGDPPGTGDQLDYFATPPVRQAVLASTTPGGLSPGQAGLGGAVAWTRADFDDTAWRHLDLPHDWAIEGPFDIRRPGETAKLPYAGVGWYRKRFTAPPGGGGRRTALDVDGAMSYALVWCNGGFVGGWPYGYSSFRLDLTRHLRADGENVVVIRLANPDDSSRWYPGAGLYRNVWLVTMGAVHLEHWGTVLTTPVVAPDQATIAVSVGVENGSSADVTVDIATEIRDADRLVAAIDCGSVRVPAGGTRSAHGAVRVPDPRLWSVADPHLYRAVTTVTRTGRVVDRGETAFGIRSVRFTADHGLLLNGGPIRLNGVCNHHDLGALGSAFNVRAAERQLQILKEMGVNALRTSHNPPAPELLDLCDRLGVLVMDESFDCWRTAKKPNDYSRLWEDWHERDLRAEVRRDRNHPSVVLWSIGNEVSDTGDAAVGPALAAELSRVVGEEDPTRPTTMGSNDPASMTNGVQTAVGVMGQNYQVGGYRVFHHLNPTVPHLGSETASAVSSRGVYVFDTPELCAARWSQVVRTYAAAGRTPPVEPVFHVVSLDAHEGGQAGFQVSSYDLYAPPWACIPDREFAAQDANPETAGEFVWTGFDYLGEPTPYTGDLTNLDNFRGDPAKRAELQRRLEQFGSVPCPARSSYFGIVDLAGFRKDRFYLYQARWRPEVRMAHLLPHWNWPERRGQVTPVFAYTSGDEAELFLNGRSLGRRSRSAPGQEPGSAYRLCWMDVVYEPGELKVIAYRHGEPWAQDVIATTGPVTAIRLEPDRRDIVADGRDLAFITARLVDASGATVPTAQHAIRFRIEGGPGRIVATDNGDPTDLTAFASDVRAGFNGLALLIVRGAPGAAGTIRVRAEADGLQPGSCLVDAR